MTQCCKLPVTKNGGGGAFDTCNAICQVEIITNHIAAQIMVGYGVSPVVWSYIFCLGGLSSMKGLTMQSSYDTKPLPSFGKLREASIVYCKLVEH